MYCYLQRDVDGKTTMIKEVYTTDKIQRFVNNQLDAEKENKYGIIPIYHFMWRDIGEKFGVNTFDSVAVQYDIINAYANIVYQIGNKMMDPIYLIKGNLTTKDRDTITTQFAKNIYEGANVLVTTPDGGAEIIDGGMENDNVKRELISMNRDIFDILSAWGKVSKTAENYTDIIFDEVFGFTRADKLSEVQQELNMGLITIDVARQKLDIEWSGTETVSDGSSSDTASPALAMTMMDNGTDTKSPGLMQRIVDAIKKIFGAGN